MVEFNNKVLASKKRIFGQAQFKGQQNKNEAIKAEGEK